MPADESRPLHQHQTLAHLPHGGLIILWDTLFSAPSSLRPS